jgi:hypothetical protein
VRIAGRRQLPGDVLPQRLVPRPDRQEFLLAGCPVVGVRTGAPFIQDGVTGVFVDRLPPGAKCVKNDADEAALAAFIHALQSVQNRDRRQVREESATAFHPVWIVDGLLKQLQGVRGHSEERAVRP